MVRYTYSPNVRTLVNNDLPTCIVADDHAVVREAVIIRLEEEALAGVIGEARNGLEAINLIRAKRPDIALVDLRMPAATGLEVAQAVAAAQLATKVIIYSACIDTSMVEAALAAGAHGYLAKEAGVGVMSSAFRSVMSGDVFVDASRPAASPVVTSIVRATEAG